MSEKKDEILYTYKSNVYLNITNACPCNCEFCIRRTTSTVGESSSLWLSHNPSFEDVKAAIDSFDFTDYTEAVFCGYGEPTERLDDLLDVAKWLKANHPGLQIRVNTNGLSDLIAGGPTAHRFKGLVDALSISLNTSDAAEYLELCRPRFGASAYPAMLQFAKDATEYVPNVIMTVVGEPVTSKEKQAACQTICDRLGVRLRIRPYEKTSRS